MDQSRATEEAASGVRWFPSARSGRGLAPEHAVRAWSTAAWLLAVEGRAYLEDMAGGVDQPELRWIVRLRLAELLLDIDLLLGGYAAIQDGHQLAMALEYGLHTVAEVDGPRLVSLFALGGGPGGPAHGDGAVPQLWEELCAAFPGRLPNPLLASGQREILRALRYWSKLCTAAGTDAAFLEPFLKDA
ncbi:MAG TPA: DUF6031 family protein [Streptosporangiaceae bacterium]|nr:DUF6031 family protein [Streptosporangiaceae bacterium]